MMKAKQRRELDRWNVERSSQEPTRDPEEIAKKQVEIEEERRRRRIRLERDTNA